MRSPIALYEASDRIGGRLWSYRFRELPNQVAEMGGMCFSPLHANVFGLCTKELRLNAENADEFSVYNLQYLRNHRFAFEDYAPEVRPDGYYPGTIPYFLKDNEKWRLPTDLMLSAFKEAVPEAGPLLDQLAKIGDKPEQARKIIVELDLALRNARLAGNRCAPPRLRFLEPSVPAREPGSLRDGDDVFRLLFDHPELERL